MAFVNAIPLQVSRFHAASILTETTPVSFNRRRHHVTATATVPTSTSPSPAPLHSLADNKNLKPPIKVSLVSLGCPKNVTDAEVMLGDLSAHGIQILPPRTGNQYQEDEFSDEQQSQQEDADVIVINTCGFVEDAKRESVEAILSAARQKQTNNTKGIIVTGCLAQRYADTLAKELPEVDAVVGFEHYHEIPSHINSLVNSFTSTDGKKEESIVRVGKTSVPFRPEHERIRLGPKHSVYIRLAEGCSHSCTFCAIPGQFRGEFRSKSWDVLTSEIKHLTSDGKVKELVLIAEDTNQYGMDFKNPSDYSHRLSDLLHHISTNHSNSVSWVRLLYCYPSYFTNSLIEAISKLDIVCKYIDIPLQHINDSVLRRMNRPSRSHTLSLLNKLREKIPGLVLRTTFITGFPGETDEEHRELVEFIKEQKFDHAGFFAYSEEEGTPAAEMSDQVPMEVREYRRDELTSVQQNIQEERATGMIGNVIDVLIDKIEDGHSIGRTAGDAPDIDSTVHILQQLPVGEFAKVRILGTSSFDLYGEPVTTD